MKYLLALLSAMQLWCASIDSIYLINLDCRPDRLQATLCQLDSYGIVPQRFSAFRGADLSLETLRGAALSYDARMAGGRWVKIPEDRGILGDEFLRGSWGHGPVFSEWMSIGAVGCALSHWSILRAAYAKGDETIWILEDDIEVKQDPRLLLGLIDRLDGLTDGNWDLLYTDSDEVGERSQPPEELWVMWRPDIPIPDLAKMGRRVRIDDAFIRIGARERTHSIVMRRSGMKKILDHLDSRGLFLPIDHELAFAEELNCYMLSFPLVTYGNSASDIQGDRKVVVKYGTSAWEKYKRQTLSKLNRFDGWCDLEKGNRLMDFIRDMKPLICAEIGSFGGSTTFPIVSALQYLGAGKVFAIDSWDNKDAVAGLASDDPNFAWWQGLDLRGIKNQFTAQFAPLKRWCSIVPLHSARAAAQFEDESIDMVYIDGNFSKQGSLQDVELYFPKVKPGGFLWLNDAHSAAKLSSVAYLMEKATWLKEESISNRCIVFQKRDNL